VHGVDLDVADLHLVQPDRGVLAHLRCRRASTPTAHTHGDRRGQRRLVPGTREQAAGAAPGPWLAGWLVAAGSASEWRTGSEGRISSLERGYGWDRTRPDGTEGARIWTEQGVFAHNLVKIGALAS